MPKQTWECPYCGKSGEVELRMFENLNSVSRKVCNDHDRVSPECTQYRKAVRQAVWRMQMTKLAFLLLFGAIVWLIFHFSS